MTDRREQDNKNDKRTITKQITGFNLNMKQAAIKLNGSYLIRHKTKIGSGPDLLN